MMQCDPVRSPTEPSNRSFRLLSDGDLASRLGEQSLEIAGLIFSAAPELYGQIPLPYEDVLRFIAGQIGKPRSELANVYLLHSGKDNLAIVADVPAADLDRAKQGTALAIIRSLDARVRATFMEALERHGALIEPLPDKDGWYVSRVASAAHARGSGIGTDVMIRLLAEKPNVKVTLHVHAENVPAIRLYSKLGFRFTTNSDYAFRVMIKEPLLRF